MRISLGAQIRGFHMPASSPPPPGGASREWVVSAPPEMVQSLLDELNEDVRTSEAVHAKGFHIAYEVVRIGRIKLEVFALEEGIPHFRVEIQGQTANYSLKDCSLLVGDIGKHENKVKKWFKKDGHRQLLIDAWTERRPTDCPIGAYRDA